METDWHKPEWSNKHVDAFANTYYWALEAVICNITQSPSDKPVRNQIQFLFNQIIDQGEEFTHKFLTEFQETYKHPQLWLQHLTLSKMIPGQTVITRTDVAEFNRLVCLLRHKLSNRPELIGDPEIHFSVTCCPTGLVYAVLFTYWVSKQINPDELLSQ